MKRLLPIVPIILLFLVNSCGPISGPTPTSSISDMWTAISLAQTATAWAPPPTQTTNPEIKFFINLLNSDLSTISSLGWVMDVQYYVTSVTYLNESERIARLDIDCTCMNSTDCCSPERTFVVIVDSMRKNKGNIPSQVFEDVGKVVVVCSDHRTKEQIGAISAPWQDIQNYLGDSTYSIQLSAHAIRIDVP